MTDIDIDQVPPQSLDVERTILGTILLDKSAAARARQMLTDDCFYASQNAVIWSAIIIMMDDGKTLDVLTVAEELRKNDQLESVGAEPYLSELVSNVATAANIESHCKILIEKSILRKAIGYCSNIAARAFSGESSETVIKSVSEFSNELNNRLEEAEIGSGSQVKILSASDLAPITQKYHQEGEQAQVFELQSLPNLSQFYKPALGFLNIWTGIPSHGKTELLNQVIVDLSQQSDWKWLIFSPESFPHYYLIQNLAEKIIGKGFFRGNDLMTSVELEAAISFLNDHIRVIDIGDGEFTSDDMLSLVRDYTAKNSIQGLVIDPIGDLEISIRKSENKTYSVARFLRMIRRMGRKKEFSPYIVAHTTKLQKDFKTHKYPVPTLYDIDGSAAYYNSAFQGITTYRYFKADVIAVHVQKIKFKPAGKVGVCFLKYNVDTGIFTPYYEDPEKVEKEMVEQQNAF
jgi:replicative DNA helicase